MVSKDHTCANDCYDNGVSVLTWKLCLELFLIEGKKTKLDCRLGQEEEERNICVDCMHKDGEVAAEEIASSGDEGQKVDSILTSRLWERYTVLAVCK